MLITKDIMTTDLITVTPDTEIAEAARIMLEKHVNGMPVVDEAGKLVGILCRSDLVAQQKRLPIPSLFTLLDGFFTLSRIDKEVEKIAAITVAHAMTHDPVTVKSSTTIEEIAELMVDKSYHTLPVVDDGKLVGIVGKEDILKTLLTQKNAPQKAE